MYDYCLVTMIWLNSFHLILFIFVSMYHLYKPSWVGQTFTTTMFERLHILSLSPPLNDLYHFIFCSIQIKFNSNSVNVLHSTLRCWVLHYCANNQRECNIYDRCLIKSMQWMIDGRTGSIVNSCLRKFHLTYWVHRNQLHWQRF